MSASAPSLLLVEDDDAQRQTLAANLRGHGYDVREAPDGELALGEWERRRPDLLLVDLGLPGMDGLNVVQRVRREAATPIIILSVRGEEHDKVLALDAGADDYLTKPFGVAELHARIRASLRRALGPAATPEGDVRIGPLEVRPTARTVTVDGQPINLTPREYEVLKVLVQNAGRLVTRARLLRAVWGTAYADEGHYLHVYVGQIRRKLAAADPDGRLADLLRAEAGIGYRVRAADP